jgi:predicted enzyme related to lactoylglutathione lyase
VSSHPIVHVELSANDREAAGKFYQDLFGWQVQHIPEMHYSTFVTGEGPAGGFSQVADGMATAGQTTVYVGTDDIDASLAKAEQLGGKILMPKMEIPNTGWMGLFQDPTGNIVGLYTAK